MGYTSPHPTTNEVLEWGDPAFMAAPTQLLVAWWSKSATPIGDGWGPALTKSDYTTGGWWIFVRDAPDELRLVTYPGVQGNLIAAPTLGTGWHHYGFYVESSGTVSRLYIDGTPMSPAEGELGVGLLTHTASNFAVYAGSATLIVAEAAVWARTDLALTDTVASSIMAKLANPAHAQRRAIDISDLPVNFYVPLFTDTIEVVGATTATGGLVNAGDHPWVEAGGGVIPIAVADTLSFSEAALGVALQQQQGVLVTETWNVGDTAGGVLTGDQPWTTFRLSLFGTPATTPNPFLRVETNRAVSAGDSSDAARFDLGRCDVPTYLPDQEASVVLGPVQADAYQFGAGVALRLNPSVPVSGYAVMAELVSGVPTDALRIRRIVADSITTIATADFTVQAGDTITGRVTGSNPVHVELLINGVSLLTVDDSDPTRLTTGTLHGIVFAIGRFMTDYNAVDTYAARDIGDLIPIQVSVGDGLGFTESVQLDSAAGGTGSVAIVMGAPTQMLSAGAIAASGVGGGSWPDSGFGVLNNGNGTWDFWASMGGFIGDPNNGKPGRVTGTFGNPLSVSSAGVTISAKKAAPDGVPDFPYQGGGPIYQDVGTGRLIMFTHQEVPTHDDHPELRGTQYYSWIGIITSTNDGATWTDCGPIITPFHTQEEMEALWAGLGKADGSEFQAEVGFGQYLVVGSYLYVYTSNCDGPIHASGLRSVGYTVARAPIADVMAAAAAETVSPWEKYTGGGTWTESGIHGTGIPLFGGPDEWLFAVGQSVALGRYIFISMVWHETAPHVGFFTLLYRDSLNGLNWSVEREIPGVNWPYPNVFYAYPTLVDPVAANPKDLSHNFYYIAPEISAGPGGVYRFPITTSFTDPGGIVIQETWPVGDTAPGVLNGTHLWDTLSLSDFGTPAVSPSPYMYVVSGRATTRGDESDPARFDVGRCATGLLGLDQEASVVIGPMEGGGYHFRSGVVLRAKPGLPFSGYAFTAEIVDGVPTNALRIIRIVDDVPTTIAMADFTVADGDTVTGRVTDTDPAVNLTLLINGTSRLTFSDTAAARLTVPTRVHHGILLQAGRFMLNANSVDTYTAQDIGQVAFQVAVGDVLGFTESVARGVVGGGAISMGPGVIIASAGAIATAGLGAWPDSGFGAVRNGDGTHTLWASAGGFQGDPNNGTPGRAIGTFDNLLASSGGLTLISNRKNAPDGNAPFKYQGGGQIYRDPSSGMLIMISHNEIYLGGGGSDNFSGTQFYSWFGILKSTNGGAGWVDCGVIVTPWQTYAAMLAARPASKDFDGSYYLAEMGIGPFVVVGGHFYVFYFNVDVPISSGNGLIGPGYCVARAPIADVLAAAAAETVSPWEKYTGNGTWTEPGIRGRGVQVFGQGGDSRFTVGYNAFLNRYLALMISFTSPTAYKVTCYESADALNWGARRDIPGALTSSYPPLYAFFSLLDPTAADPHQLGSSFYFIGRRTDTNDTYRFPVTVTAAPAGDFDVGVADTLGFTETVGVALAPGAVVSARATADTVAFSDAVTAQRIVLAFVTLDDFLVTNVIGAAASVADSLTFTETVGAVLFPAATFSVSVTDPLALTDGISVVTLTVLIVPVSVADDLLVSDALGYELRTLLQALVADEVSFSDALGYELRLVFQAALVSDDLIFSDALGHELRPLFQALVADEVSFSDALTTIELNAINIDPDAGIIYLTDETFRISAAGSDLEIGGIAKILRTICKRPVPEQSAFEYRVLLQNAGAPVTDADIESLTLTLQNLADGQVVNGIDQTNILNVDRGRLSTGRLLVGLDAPDLRILSDISAYETRLMTIEGVYGGGRRVFRKEIVFVLINLTRVS